jgi:glycosyltransferase involved in cell wall biosynthesis
MGRYEGMAIIPSVSGMRIAYLSTQTAYYGGEVHLQQLATGMRRRGHYVGCVVRPASGLASRLTSAGVPVQTLPLVDWFEPSGCLRLRRWLQLQAIQILHTHTPRDYYLAAVASLGTPVCNIGTRHQLFPIGARWLKRPFLRRFAAMIAVSEAVRRCLLASRVIAPDKVVTIHNGIDITRSLPARDGLRRAVGLTATIPVIGFVGRLCPEKGIETVLVAARDLIAHGWPDLKLFIVGDDPAGGRYARWLRRLVAAYDLQAAVHFFGYVEDAARACADFDVQVICSHAEPFGLVTLEGMAHRHPVVATTTGGSREIVRHGVDGFLVPPGDAVALAHHLRQLLDRPHLRRRLGENARQRVEDAFSLERMLVATEALYARVLDQKYPAATGARYERAALPSGEAGLSHLDEAR